MGALPNKTMSATTNEDFAMSPPASGTRYWSAKAKNPSRKPSIHFPVSSAGNASDKNATSGRAPMAARSLRPRARHRWPTLCGGCQSRWKCTFSSERSVVTTISRPLRGRSTAQSSPIPSVRIPLQRRPRRWRALFRMDAISSRSPAVLPGPDLRSRAITPASYLLTLGSGFVRLSGFDPLDSLC